MAWKRGCAIKKQACFFSQDTKLEKALSLCINTREGVPLS